MQRKGFPESYDRRALLRFVTDVKSGIAGGPGPGLLPPDLRHRPRREVVVRRPDVLIVEGLNVLQPARAARRRRQGVAVSDFFDFSIYVDAATEDVRQWYVERFLRLRETAFADPESYFHRYAALYRRRGRRPGRADLARHQRAQPASRTSCRPGAGPPWC